LTKGKNMSLESAIKNMLNEETMMESNIEEATDKTIAKVANAIKNAPGGIFDLKEPLKKAGFKKAEYSSSPVPNWMIKDGKKVIIIANKKYAEDADEVVGAYAIGYM